METLTTTTNRKGPAGHYLAVPLPVSIRPSFLSSFSLFIAIVDPLRRNMKRALENMHDGDMGPSAEDLAVILQRLEAYLKEGGRCSDGVEHQLYLQSRVDDPVRRPY